MNEFEKIKFEAFKEAREDQEVRGEELAEKVDEIKAAKSEMVASDSTAREILERYKDAKGRKNRVQSDFETEVLGDSLSRESFKKKGIESLEQYVNSEEGSKREMASTYRDSKSELADIRNQLRNSVEARAETKDDLLEKIKKNEPEAKNRTFRGLEGTADLQIGEIRNKEIMAVVNELLDTTKKSILNFLTEVYEKKSTTFPNIYTKEIVFKLGELGETNHYTMEKVFLEKIGSLTPKLIDEWWGGLDTTIKEKIISKT